MKDPDMMDRRNRAAPDETLMSRDVVAFAARTGLSHEQAVTYLQECDWNMSVALKRFELETEKDYGIKPSTSQDKVGCTTLNGKLTTPGYAFYLPDLNRVEPDFRWEKREKVPLHRLGEITRFLENQVTFLEKDLIETQTQKRLETSKHLNWWSAFGERLYPLSTTGDGNCLLHAASLGMWGLHDRQLTLREALYEMLQKGSRRSALWRRWKWSEHQSYQAIGLSLSEDEWMNEWNNNIVALASPTPRKPDSAENSDSSDGDSTDQIYESLEAVHVFALAHVLKRPIVVVSDTVLRNAKGEELSPVPFGGVYLPLECPSDQCIRSPLVLCYDSAHFSPLIPMRHNGSLQRLIPITDANRNLLTLHFAVDPGPDFTWWRDEEDTAIAARLELSDGDRLALMSEYMDLVRLDVRRGSVKKTRSIRTTAASATEKSLTLASSGVAGPGSLEKKRIINEITQQFLRTFRISSGKHKDSGIDARLCAEELSRTSCVLAARLVSSSHEYMEDMVEEYMRSARQRYQTNTKTVTTAQKRISRSFSASSLAIHCINSHCDRPARQCNNFLCEDCFEAQKELMTSFSCENPTVLRPLPGAAGKSQTMPSIAQPHRTTAPLVVHNSSPILGVVTRQGKTTQNVSAVQGEYGVTHYFIDDDDVEESTVPQATSITSVTVTSSNVTLPSTAVMQTSGSTRV